MYIIYLVTYLTEGAKKTLNTRNTCKDASVNETEIETCNFNTSSLEKNNLMHFSEFHIFFLDLIIFIEIRVIYISCASDLFFFSLVLLDI